MRYGGAEYKEGARARRVAARITRHAAIRWLLLRPSACCARRRRCRIARHSRECRAAVICAMPRMSAYSFSLRMPCCLFCVDTLLFTPQCRDVIFDIILRAAYAGCLPPFQAPAAPCQQVCDIYAFAAMRRCCCHVIRLSLVTIDGDYATTSY